MSVTNASKLNSRDEVSTLAMKTILLTTGTFSQELEYATRTGDKSRVREVHSRIRGKVACQLQQLGESTGFEIFLTQLEFGSDVSLNTGTTLGRFIIVEKGQPLAGPAQA